MWIQAGKKDPCNTLEGAGRLPADGIVLWSFGSRVAQQDPNFIFRGLKNQASPVSPADWDACVFFSLRKRPSTSCIGLVTWQTVSYEK